MNNIVIDVDKDYADWMKQHRARWMKETKVKKLVRTCGIRMTALYLKNRGYTAEQAITLMFR